MVSLTFLDFSLAALGVFILHRFFSSKRRQSLPPGPKGLPLIGNVLDMPSSYEWLTFAKWGEQWGDIISVNLPGQHLIILNSAHDAVEMLEKKSNIYSDRPTLLMGGEIVGWNSTLALTRYGERFREYRRYLTRIMGTKSALQSYHNLIEEETSKFLRRLLQTPEHVHKHIRKTAGAIILMMAYGYAVEEDEDPYVNQVDKAVTEFTIVTTPGAFLVDVLPVLRYLPSWFPGAGFQRIASEWREDLRQMADIPYELVKQKMREGAALPSFTSRLLESEKLTREKEFNIKWSAASMYSGGADTTVSAIYSFFLAMTLNPEAQIKAQKEIDVVVGNDRLPTIADRDSLPYVDALLKEVLRYNPIGPLGLPHRVSDDDIYAGYLIPKGSLVFANIWAIAHNPKVYSNPSAFNPDRYLGSNPEPDPREFVFGFGRRICPGHELSSDCFFQSTHSEFQA
ncbi:unnamed protein product [Somion occarium]|uniref:Cytochrome P450 n=1 Tax=Somion occarium TaxID=3059160 RepID=A0ABP1D5S1_9APHY